MDPAPRQIEPEQTRHRIQFSEQQRGVGQLATARIEEIIRKMLYSPIWRQIASLSILLRTQILYRLKM